MRMVSHYYYELHDDELARFGAFLSLSESHRITRVRHGLIAAMCYDRLRCIVIALWICSIVLKYLEQVLPAQKWAAYSYCPGCELAK